MTVKRSVVYISLFEKAAKSVRIEKAVQKKVAFFLAALSSVKHPRIDSFTIESLIKHTGTDKSYSKQFQRLIDHLENLKIISKDNNRYLINSEIYENLLKLTYIDENTENKVLLNSGVKVINGKLVLDQHNIPYIEKENNIDYFLRQQGIVFDSTKTFVVYELEDIKDGSFEYKIAEQVFAKKINGLEKYTKRIAKDESLQTDVSRLKTAYINLNVSKICKQYRIRPAVFKAVAKRLGFIAKSTYAILSGKYSDNTKKVSGDKIIRNICTTFYRSNFSKLNMESSNSSDILYSEKRSDNQQLQELFIQAHNDAMYNLVYSKNIEKSNSVLKYLTDSAYDNNLSVPSKIFAAANLSK